MTKTMKIKESTKDKIGKSYLFLMILAFAIMSFALVANDDCPLLIFVVIIICQALELLFIFYYVRVYMCDNDKEHLQKQIDELKSEIERIKSEQ